MNENRAEHGSQQRGFSLVELMIALGVIALGVMAVAQLFPAATRGQLEDRLRTAASYHAQEQIENLRTAGWSHTDMGVGRHPQSGTEGIGVLGIWRRFYEVEQLPEPLANIKRVDVTVSFMSPAGPDTIVASTYMER